MGIPSILAAGIGGSVFATYLLNYFYPWLKYDWKQLIATLKVAASIKRYINQGMGIVDIFEQTVSQHPTKTFLIFQDNNYSYEFMNRKMNKVGRVGLELGLKKGDTVAILMENEPAFIWTVYGLVRIGVQPATLNYNLRLKSLLHCFTVSGANTIIVGQSQNDELIKAVQGIQSELEALNVQIYIQGHVTNCLPNGFQSFESFMHNASDDALSDSERVTVDMGSPMGYMFTSGTTGLPKAVIGTHGKSIKVLAVYTIHGVDCNDIIYTALPLYHGAAMVSLVTVMATGGTLVLRKKFSATHFWDDCAKHNVTVISYIGELFRYLLARPKSPNDQKHKVRLAVGNGLRQDIWEEFQKRFNIPRIGEMYAASEGNVGFINLFNKTGAVGRMSPLFQLIYPAVFVKYDIDKDEVVRDADGLCIQVKPGEPGLLLGKIKKNFEFDGYKGNRELSEKKIVSDVLAKGDRYFNSGDLLTLDEEYFVYFTDRIGDTFRWKGENVSTIEVSNVIADLNWIEDANVYGVTVPGQDGRAGMAAICLAKDYKGTPENLKQLYQHCEDQLPVYARPRFIRIQRELEITSTFKQRKVELVKEGFDPSVIRDPLYYMDMASKTYEKLETSVFDSILKAEIRL